MNMDNEKGIKTFTVTINSDDIGTFETYRKTAGHLAEKFNLDKAQCEYIARCIKLYGHHQKLSVYSRMDLYFNDVDSVVMKEFLKDKIKTHEQYSKLDPDSVL